MARSPYSDNIAVKADLTRSAAMAWDAVCRDTPLDDLKLSTEMHTGDLIAVTDDFVLRVERRLWQHLDDGWCLVLRLDSPARTRQR